MLTTNSLILKMQCNEGNQKTDRYVASWPATAGSGFLQVPRSPLVIWTRHIQSLCSKARKLIGLIYHHFYQHSSPESFLQMYLTLLRPHLVSFPDPQVWNTSKIGETDSLAIEKVQKFALRVCSKQWNSSYDELLQLYSLCQLCSNAIHDVLK